MDRATMLAQFRIAAGDRATKVGDTEVLRYMNRIWEYELPSDIDGGFRQGDISFSFTAGQAVYDLDDATDVGAGNAGYVYQVKKGIALVDRTDILDEYESTAEFWSRQRRNDTSEGRPIRVLVQERTLTFYPAPEAGTPDCAVPCSLYREPLTTDGIANDEWAWAVVRGGARDWLLDRGYILLSKGQDAFYQDHKDRLTGQSLSAKPKGNASRRVHAKKDY